MANAPTISELNTYLYRPIMSAQDDLFPPIKGKQVDLGEGDTFFSVEKIAKSIKDNYLQSKKVAEMLSKKSLKETATAIHSFIYNHFQYSADGILQTIKSPSYSWYDRYNGIDCKSYTVLAGSILMNLGYTFYIRQIKQAGAMPNEFTHVYAVVPIDQEKGSLSKGYYTIDGTIPTMREVNYIEKSDLKMNKLKHVGLAGIHARGLNACGCGAKTSETVQEIQPQIIVVENNSTNEEVEQSEKKGFFDKQIKVGWAILAFVGGYLVASSKNGN